MFNLLITLLCISLIDSRTFEEDGKLSAGVIYMITDLFLSNTSSASLYWRCPPWIPHSPWSWGEEGLCQCQWTLFGPVKCKLLSYNCLFIWNLVARISTHCPRPVTAGFTRCRTPAPSGPGSGWWRATPSFPETFNPVLRSGPRMRG